MKYNIETKCIHNEKQGNNPFGSVVVPIYQSATFSHPGIGDSTGYDYSRESNPTRTELEEIITGLEGGLDTLACTNGMAAIALAMEIFDRGDHIICSQDAYGGTVRILDNIGIKRGLEITYVDSGNIDEVRGALRENTKGIIIETPGNPLMTVSDLGEIGTITKENNILFLVDNTFLTPYFQRPIEFGADIVIHSGTKFLGGHNDTLSGFITVNDTELSKKFREIYKTIGCCLSPFDSFLVIRGIKTLAVRMEKQQQNAMIIARELREMAKIKKVYYVGLDDHVGYEISKKQTTGFGSMISFKVDCEDTARKILERVKIITYAESLGGVESLITYPMLQTHGDVPLQKREMIGITEDFLRLSVGLENPVDILNDLKQAME